MSVTSDREGFDADAVLTVQDLLDAVQRDAALAATRRRDVASALRRLCRAFGVTPSRALASHASFRHRLRGFHPGQAGLSTKRFQNIRSDVLFALNRYVVGGHRHGAVGAVSSAWRRLRAQLTREALHYGLSRFIEFCGLEGIEPETVDDSAFERFRTWLAERTLVENPDRLWRRAARLWNRAVADVEGWPKRALAVPPQRAPYCLAWDDLPERLRREADLWLARLAGADILADDAPLRPARPATIRARRLQIRQIVSAWTRRGHDLQELTGLEALVAPARVREVLRFFLERSGGEPTSQIANVAWVLVAIARDWVRVDGTHLEELQRVSRKVTPRHGGLTDKNRARLRQFDSERNKALILGLPLTLARAVERATSPTRKQALLFQTATAIELLLMMPLRL